MIGSFFEALIAGKRPNITPTDVARPRAKETIAHEKTGWNASKVPITKAIEKAIPRPMMPPRIVIMSASIKNWKSI